MKRFRCTFLICISVVMVFQLSLFISRQSGDVGIRISPRHWLDIQTVNYLDERKPTSLINKEESYIFALRYSEQLVNSIDNLFQLGHLGKELDARLVVPQVSASRLYGLSNFIPSGGWGLINPLSDYIDIESLAIKSCNISMSPLRDFLETSPEQIVLFHPIKLSKYGISIANYSMDISNPGVRKDLKACVHFGACSCKEQLYNVIDDIEGALNSLASSRSLPKFTVSDAICFDSGKAISMKQLLQHRTSNGSKVSYIFTLWSGSNCYHSEDRDLAKSEWHCLQIARHGGSLPIMMSGTRSCKRLTSTLATSIHTHVEELSSEFLRAQGMTPHTHLVTVHVRIEKLQTANDTVCCLQEMLSRVHHLKQMFSNIKVVLITDLGPLGSHSCYKENCRYLKYLSMQIFSANNITPVYFDAVQYGVKNDSALASLVEMLAVAKGNEVILVGGGQFQVTLLQNILARVEVGYGDRTLHLYSICSKSTRNHLLNLNEDLTSTISYKVFEHDKCLDVDSV